MLLPLRALLSLSLLTLALAACEPASSVDLESRNFNVQQTSVPPGEAVASTEQITGLVRRSGPTYVTLIVSQPAKPDNVSKDSRKGTPVTSGSGFVVEGSGYVMTAAHVGKRVGNTVSAKAANGRVYSGEVIAIKPDNDMALVRLRGFSGKAVTPADSQCLARGNIVYSLGRPHAQGDTARLGEFESPSFGQAVHYPGADARFGYPDAMVLRLSTQKGESGGPLFNEKGDLVGMVVSTLYDNAGQPLNLAHAVPSGTLAGFLCSTVQCSAEWRAVAAGSGRCDS
ncbi:serine protease [Aestuariivirga sp.]|uniref:S1 family peptidase n=1 Tax=Aestuariivirga sp. TaxID=2650926 RepID=UPI0025BA2A54|nr:serine protease [Aestuariivirga sp.]MCA3555210.1 trypsin-like peptidase domain-containing protein [Aestuariivirga sp.]